MLVIGLVGNRYADCAEPRSQFCLAPFFCIDIRPRLG
jgi:hypothetical protein